MSIREAESSLASFLRQAWETLEPTTPLVWGKALDAICAHLEAVERGEILNIYIATPPGTTKSITTNVVFPAWCWIRQPSLRFLCAANAGDLVTRDAVSCRRLLESDWFKERWGDRFALTSDQNVKTWYENDKRGFRTSITVGSKTTGRKGDILIVDDAHDTREVESEVQRRSVITWWDQAFYNRVNDPKTGRRVVIGQRTHSEDLPGHLIARGDFVELRLPEEFEPATRCVTPIWQDWRTEAGELLRPDRFGPAQVVEARKTLGSMGYAAQHQQNPVPAEGAIFKKDWLRYYKPRVDGGTLPTTGKSWNWDACRRFGTVDLAVSTKTTADYTVICCWGDDKRGNLLLMEMVRARLEGPDIVPKLWGLLEKWDLDWFSIENVAFQLALIQQARREGLPCRELNRDRDKVSRAMAATVRFEAGQVWLPEGALWLPDLEKELLLFPAAPHDDIVDAVVDGCLEMTRLYASKVAKPAVVANLTGGLPAMKSPWGQRR